MGQDHLIGLVTACPEGKICDDSLGNAICRIDQLPTTTTELPVTPPSCFDSGKYPGPICYQYYECVKVLWWWQSKLKDCPVGQAFDETVEECNTAAWSKCQPTTTIVPTTTSVTYVSPVTGPPACFGPAVDQNNGSDNYNNGSYDHNNGSYDNNNGSYDYNKEPLCFGPSKYPAPQCDQYYECVQILWWWQPKLKNCPSEQAFNSSTNICMIADLTNCIPKPACYGSSKHPAPSPNQYYECVPFLWWWQPTLKACPEGQNFVSSVAQCVDQNLENTFSRFLPKCTAPRKYQAPRQGQYYECEFVSSEWLLKLKACPNSELEIFDPDLQMCREDSQTK
ncbi:hypothetical protein MTP99_001440 [Tenebrio molitor]|nr:hypothetical protein MTP99_001440 [Tenebrio molitor]